MMLRRARPFQFAIITVLLIWQTTARGFEMEMAAVTVNDTFSTQTWTNVSFLNSFDAVPVVVALTTNQGGDPSILRIRNVTTSGFSIVATEPNANDGPHVAMQTAYLAVEPGNHVLPDGTRLQAFIHNTSSTVSQSLGVTWDTVVYGSPFANAPAVVASIQTDLNESGTPPSTSSIPFLGVAMQNVGNTSLQISLERAESTAGTVALAESIGVIAIDSNRDLSFVDQFGSNVVFKTLRTGSNIRGFSDGCFTNSWPTPFSQTPLSVASAITRAGNNGGWLRRCSESAGTLGLTVDEDIDADAERNHTNEAAGAIGASLAFHSVFDVELSIGKTVSTLSDPDSGTTNPMSIPGAVVQYTLSISNRGTISPDTDSVTIRDVLPAEISLCVSAVCQTPGPVIFDDSASPTATGVTLGTIRYSNDGGASFGYTPTADADGFDILVDAIEITLAGDLAAISSAGEPEIALRMSARIN